MAACKQDRTNGLTLHVNKVTVYITQLEETSYNIHKIIRSNMIETLRPVRNPKVKDGVSFKINE